MLPGKFFPEDISQFCFIFSVSWMASKSRSLRGKLVSITDLIHAWESWDPHLETNTIVYSSKWLEKWLLAILQNSSCPESHTNCCALFNALFVLYIQCLTATAPSHGVPTADAVNVFFPMKTLTSVGSLQTLQASRERSLLLPAVCVSFPLAPSLPLPHTHTSMAQSFAEARCGHAEYCVVKWKEQQ